MNRPKMLTPLKPSNSTPKIIAFDTEDNGQGAPNNFICACFYDGDHKHVFWDRSEARAFIFNRQRTPTIFFAHNLAYDLANVDYPEGTAKLIPIATRLIGAKYKHPKSNTLYQFMDTGNFFVGASIESLGEQLGYPKIKFDVSRIKNKTPDQLDEQTKEELSFYCMRDAEICYKTALHLVTLTHQNKTKFKAYTAPALSMRIFRTNFLHEPIICRKQRINDYERKSYYGGRTEVFDYRYHDEVDYEDIKSSYPTAMRYKHYPYPPSFKLLTNADWSSIRNMEGVSLVTVDVPNNLHIPPLPYRRKDDGRLIFPVGRWSGAYAHNELRMAEQYGVTIRALHQSLVYSKTFTPFVDYVDTFYPLKESTTGIIREYNKLMLNGLSGKFGEKRKAIYRMKLEDLRVCCCAIPPEPVDGNMCPACKRLQLEGTTPIEPDNNGWISILGSKLPDPKHTFPILISYICAYGRIKLYDERLSKCDAIYCDTDSDVSVTSPGINTGKNLGNWEIAHYREFVAYAPKYYHYKYKDKKTGEWKTMLKLKGVPGRHTIIYVCEDCDTHNTDKMCSKCKAILDDRHKRYSFDRPLKLAEAIRRKLAPNQWRNVIKQITTTDNKRIKHNDGTSSPIRIFENEPINTFDQLIKTGDHDEE